MMDRLRAERRADKRYPETMARLRRLIEACGKGALPAQICAFLERAVLSRHDGVETARDRVNLLTLHSTKGLEFSRVYIVGVEDEQFIPLPPSGEVRRIELEEARRQLAPGTFAQRALRFARQRLFAGCVVRRVVVVAQQGFDRRAVRQPSSARTVTPAGRRTSIGLLALEPV